MTSSPDKSDRSRTRGQRPGKAADHRAGGGFSGSSVVPLRLVSLIGMFFLVLYLMFEARKPENWMWMGFDDPQQDKGTADPAVSAGGMPQAMPPGSQAQEDWPVDESGGGRGAAGESAGKADLSSGFPPSDADPPAEREFDIQLGRMQLELEEVEDDFWQQVTPRLNVARQKTLFQLVRFARGDISADEQQQQEFGNLLQRMEAYSGDYQAKLLEHIGSLPRNQEDEKRLWHEVLFEFQQRWDDGLFAAWKRRMDGVELRPAELKRLGEFRSRIRRHALRGVTDRSSISRPDESLAWLLLWEDLLAQTSRSGQPGAAPATQLKLSSQMDVLRGQSVRVQGSLRGARRLATPGNLLGIDEYFELWVRSRESPTIPICVYCRQLPEGFPLVGNELQELDEVVTVSGFAYKVQSYRSAGGWAHCPVVLADELTWTPASASSAETAKLPRWEFVVLALAGMVGIAVFVARVAFQSSQLLRPRTHPQREQSVASQLGQLKNNPAVETVGQRLQRVAQEQMELDKSQPGEDSQAEQNGDRHAGDSP